MALLTNAFHTFGATGNREDLTELLSNISPKEAPMYDAFGTTQARGTYHEWQTDELAAAAHNSKLEGETFTASARTPTQRYGNYTMISLKMFTVTETQEVVNKAARGSEVAYQKAKALAELKRDFEVCLVTAGASASAHAGATDVPRRFDNVLLWVGKVKGHTGYSGMCTGDPNSILTGSWGTDHTADATIAEGTFNLILQDIWDDGGMPNAVYVNGALKRVISGWGTSTSRVWTGEKRITNVVDVYEGDFSTVELKKDRHVFSSCAFILDESMWRKSILIPAGEIPLARRGLGYDKMIRQEWTIEARNPTANGLLISA